MLIVNDVFTVDSTEEAFMVSQDVNAFEDGVIDEIDFAFMWGVYPRDFEWIKVAS